MRNPDRRINERIEKEFKVSYVHDGDYLISYTRDVSVDGMFIFTDSPPAIGETIRLTFNLGGEELTVSADVIWSNSPQTSADIGMGVRFLKPSEKLKKAVLHFVNKVAVFETQA